MSTFILSALDVALASKLAGAEHSIVRITAAGAACARCHRLLDVIQWASPCPGPEPAMLPTQPLSVGPTEPGR